MLLAIHPKLPMRNKAITKQYYIDQLGFKDIGAADYPDYLILKRDEVEIHFFSFANLDPLDNYGQVYIRTNSIDDLYKMALEKGLHMSGGGRLELKPWGQKEFSLLDPDHNLLTFGESVI